MSERLQLSGSPQGISLSPALVFLCLLLLSGCLPSQGLKPDSFSRRGDYARDVLGLSSAFPPPIDPPKVPTIQSHKRYLGPEWDSVPHSKTFLEDSYIPEEEREKIRELHRDRLKRALQNFPPLSTDHHNFSAHSDARTSSPWLRPSERDAYRAYRARIRSLIPLSEGIRRTLQTSPPHETEFKKGDGHFRYPSDRERPKPRPVRDARELPVKLPVDLPVELPEDPGEWLMP